MNDIMIGHPSCPRRFHEAVRSIGMAPFCIAVPPVTPSLESVFLELLEKAAMRADAELSVNDWGTLYRCAKMKEQGRLSASLTAGVLLAGQDTDPLLMTLSEEEMPAAQRLHAGTPSVFELVPFLREMGVTRLTLCAQPLPFPEKGPELPVTLMTEAVVSVFPCRQACGMCGTADFCRGGRILHCRENLLVTEMPAEQPPWADRVLTLQDTR